MADGSDPVFASARFALFALLAILGPGVALQRLARVRVDPALVIPAGLLYCGAAYWLSLVSGWPLLFPALVVLVDAVLLRPGLRLAPDRPTLQGALPAVAVLVAVLALAQYRTNRVGPDGAFGLDVGEHVDTALHVGVTWELVAGYPPQVPGLAGVPMQYHVGSHLVRAAAVRWVGIHPYDSLSRFDVTLWGIALVLALRAAAHALRLGEGTLRLAGFLPLAADLSFVPGLLLGSPNAAVKLGGNFIEAVLFANSISPAMAAVLAALVALERSERGEGRGYLVLAAGLGAGASFLKVFTGAQLLLALVLAWLARRTRHGLVAVATAVAIAVAFLALGSLSSTGNEGVRVALLPFAPTNPARLAFGLEPARGVALVLSGLAWLVLSLGLRAAGVRPALVALRDSSSAAASLAALALTGWPIALFVSITADPAYDESFYFLQASGLALFLLATPVLLAWARGSGLRALTLLLLTLPATAELVFRRAVLEPEPIGAPTVRAMAALSAASCPGDIVLTRPGVVRVPPVVVLAGRRVPLANFIPYWSQFTTPEVVAVRGATVFAFFRAPHAEGALAVARGLGARFVYFAGSAAEALEAAAGSPVRPRAVRDMLLEAGSLEPVHVEPRAAVYRFKDMPAATDCRARRHTRGSTYAEAGRGEGTGQSGSFTRTVGRARERSGASHGKGRPHRSIIPQLRGNQTVDFVLKRKGGVPLHDQLLAQLELRILTGVLAPGQRLPSVRALARRHGLHANTVSSAYRDLEAAGHVELRRGAGVYVRAGSPAALEDARGLDELIRLALRAAFRKGHSGAEIRSAVERWLRAAPPERVVMVDPRRETVELVVHEIRSALGVPASGCTLEELEREPALASGALLVALPYHVSKVVRAAPGVPVETIRVEGSEDDQKAVLSLPAGGTVLLVSGSPILLQIAQAIIGGLRGDELLVEARLVSRRAEWRRLLPAADLVLADALSAGVVREARPRRLRELRILGDADLARLRKSLNRAESAA